MNKNIHPDQIDSNCLSGIATSDRIGLGNVALQQQRAAVNVSNCIDDVRGHGSDDEISATYRSRSNDREYLFCPLRPRTSENIILDCKQQPITIARMLGTRPLRGELQTRPGPGGKKLLYMSGEAVSRSLNDIFGYDGWDLKIIKTEQTVCEKQQSSATVKWCVAYIAHVRITHSPSGTIKEDIGAGDSLDKHLPTAIQHAIKASITDATKRAARHFGDKLGNILYQGNFSVNSAPKTLGEALQQYDQQREILWNCNRDTSRLADTSTAANTNAQPRQSYSVGAAMSMVQSTSKFTDQVKSAAHVISSTTENENMPAFNKQEGNGNSRKRSLLSCSSNLMEANNNITAHRTSETEIQDNQHVPNRTNPYKSSTVANNQSLINPVTSSNTGNDSGIKRFQNKSNQPSNDNDIGKLARNPSSTMNVVSDSPFTESDEVPFNFDPFESGWLAELNGPLTKAGSCTSDNRLSALFNPITLKSAQVSTPVVGEPGTLCSMRNTTSIGLPAPATGFNLQSRVKNPYMSSK